MLSFVETVRRPGPRRNRRGSSPVAIRLAVLLVVVCCVGAFVAPDLSLGATRTAAGATATSLDLDLTPAVVDDGAPATLAGRLTAADAGVPAASVDESWSTDGATWSEPATVTTDADGRFSLRVAPSPQGRTFFRAAFAGDDTYASATAQVTLEVRAVVPAPTVPRTVGAGTTFVITGLISARQLSDGGQALIEGSRLVSGVWKPLLTVSAPLSDSAAGRLFRGSVALSPAGAWRLRATYADDTHVESPSRWSARVVVTPGADAPIWDRDGVTTVPERMTSRLNARLLVVVTGRTLGSRDGRLRLFRYRDGDWVRTLSVPARFGEHGLTDGRTRRAGTRTTPTGIWRLPGFAFGMHVHGPSGLLLAWRHITRRSWWSAERNATYNTWVETSRSVYGEHLADYPGPYEFAISSGYNAPPNPCVYGRGTAIFLHVIHRGYSGGCIMMPRADLVRLLRRLDPAARPACAVGTTRAGRTATSILAY